MNAPRRIRLRTRASRFAPAIAVSAATVTAVAATLAAAAPPAAAATGIQYGIQDDAWLAHGAGTLESRLEKFDALGVRLVRFNLHWDELARSRPAAPTDPSDTAYDWSVPDAILNGLHEHGVAVVLGLVGAPAWANGGHGSNYAPTSGATFAAFASAAAQEYPWVRQWLIWNEPNQRRWLLPTVPAVYVTRLLNPAYAAIHRAIPGAKVGGGVTAPRAATGGVSPVAWIHGMRAAHARLDAYAHNPYPLDPKRETPRTGGCRTCETISMATIGRLLSEVGRSFGPKRIWLTEYGYQTNPPDAVLGVSPTLQARYVGEGALVANRTPRVDMLIQYLYRDEPEIGRFQSGLVTLTNQIKPALAAFELPLAEVSRNGATTTLWGQVRAPAGGATYRIQQSSGAGWRNLTSTLHVRTGGYFGYTGRLARGTVVRVVAGSVSSAPIVVT